MKSKKLSKKFKNSKWKSKKFTKNCQRHYQQKVTHHKPTKSHKSSRQNVKERKNLHSTIPSIQKPSIHQTLNQKKLKFN